MYKRQFEDFEIVDINKVKDIFDSLKVEGLDALDLLIYVAHKITNMGFVEIGHAMIFDAAKFLVAYYLLSLENTDIQMLLDEVVLAYLLPQLEYFMPKLRKGKVFGEEKYVKMWEGMTRIFEELNLPLTLKRLREAEEEFKVIS